MLIQLQILYAAILALITGISLVFSQNASMGGRILDANNKQPVALAHVQCHSMNTNVVTNMNGVFKMTIANNSFKQGDTVTISCLGYESKKIFLFYNQDTVIYLQPTIYLLPEISVSSKVNYLSLGVKKSKIPDGDFAICGQENFQVAMYIPNEEAVSGVLKKASFYITKEGIPQTPFRIRIYGVDTVRLLPGKDLLEYSHLVYHNKKRGWIEVDLLNYRIPFPPNGLYVAMEWIYDDEKFHYKRKMGSAFKQKTEKDCFGQTIGFIVNKKQNMSFCKSIKTDWHPFLKFKNRNASPMINIEVQY